VRAGINLQYSQGFNPHPRMSLPLPRPVGVASDDELLTLKVRRDPFFVAQDTRHEARETSDELRIKNALSMQLPEGCELISADFAGLRTSFQPRSAAYVFSVRQECLDRDLTGRIRDLLASETLLVRRRMDEEGSVIKNMDVRGFLSVIEVDRADIVVECGLTAAGSIRVPEILELLGLDETKLASPIKRTSVKWQDV